MQPPGPGIGNAQLVGVAAVRVRAWLFEGQHDRPLKQRSPAASTPAGSTLWKNTAFGSSTPAASPEAFLLRTPAGAYGGALRRLDSRRRGCRTPCSQAITGDPPTRLGAQDAEWWTHGLPAVDRFAAGRRPGTRRRRRPASARQLVASARGQERPFGRTPLATFRTAKPTGRPDARGRPRGHWRRPERRVGPSEPSCPGLPGPRGGTTTCGAPPWLSRCCPPTMRSSCSRRRRSRRAGHQSCLPGTGGVREPGCRSGSCARYNDRTRAAHYHPTPRWRGQRHPSGRRASG